jgi:hypothetical protein
MRPRFLSWLLGQLHLGADRERARKWAHITDQLQWLQRNYVLHRHDRDAQLYPIGVNLVLTYAQSLGLISGEERRSIETAWLGAAAADAVRALPAIHQLEILQSWPDLSDLQGKIRDGSRHSAFLESHGITARDEALYLAALFGPETTELILKSAGEAPADAVLDPNVFDGIFRDSTARDVVDWANARANACFISADLRAELLAAAQRTGRPVADPRLD